MKTPSAKKPPMLTLPRPVVARIVSAALAEAPREACGLLVGEATARRTRVARQAAACNDDPRPAERFRLAPADFLAAERAARADGLVVVGFWHSHPATAAVPSAADRAAAWEGYSYVIVSLAGARPELRSWRLAGGRLLEEPIEEIEGGIEDGAGEPAREAVPGKATA